MKKFFFLAVCALCAISMSAQRASSTSSSTFFSTQKSDESIKIGVRAGINFSTLNDAVGGTTDSRFGWQAGAIVDIPIIESLHIQPGLFLVQKGGKQDVAIGDDEDLDVYTIKYNPLYLEVPILASYRYNFSDAWQLQVNFGPYVGFGIAGKTKFSDTYYYDVDDEPDVYSFNKNYFSTANRFDFGLQVGIGLTVAQHFYVGTSYDFGLLKNGKKFTYDDEEELNLKQKHNNSWYVTIGYNF